MKKIISLCSFLVWSYFLFSASYTGLAFIAEQADTKVKLTTQGTPDPISLQYKHNTGAWTNYTLNDEITLTNKGDSVLFRATSANATFSKSCSEAIAANDAQCNYYKFVVTKLVSLDGNVMYLLKSDGKQTSVPEFAFCHLFKNCSIKTISNTLLPATTLAEKCYVGMFSGCASLTNLPSNLLPAENIETECYKQMFYGCSGLTNIPADVWKAKKLGQRCYHSMFYNCTGLRSLPSTLLPIKTLTEHCYGFMFSGCSGLTSLPTNFMSATNLAKSCCWGMFANCTGLTSLPADLLPATTLAQSCYNGMFYRCTNLVNIPENLLPTKTLADSCYYSMFYGCTGFTSLPEKLLPATSLKKDCYAWMFRGCSGLTTLPDNLLPATNLVEECYKFMFFNCSALSNSSFLPATSLVKGCYDGMFQNCSNLCYVDVAFTGWNGDNSTVDWLDGVRGDGCFICPEALDVTTRDASHVPTDKWKINNCNPKEGLKFIATQDNTEVTLTKRGSPPDVSLEYSLNTNKWIPYTIGTAINIPNTRDTLIFRARVGDNAIFSKSLTDQYSFNTTKPVSLAGNIMYLLSTDGSGTDVPAYAFTRLFWGSDVVSIADTLLPAKTLSEDCYSDMFRDCTSLTSLPVGLLPATTLASSCYARMFQDCTGLISLPEKLLPATSLASYCYNFMFSGCTSIVELPDAFMLATTLVEGCCNGMFLGCSNLTNSSFLQANRLEYYCYSGMFSNCTNLNHVKVGFTDWNSGNSTRYWLDGVSTEGCFLCPEILDVSTRDASHVPTDEWRINDCEKYKNGLKFFAKQDGTQVKLDKNGSPSAISLQYSLNAKEWKNYTLGTNILIPAVGDSLVFRANPTNPTFSTSPIDYYNFSIGTGKVDIAGDVMYLLSAEGDGTSVPEYAFCHLFQDCLIESIADTLLPATTLAKSCYESMFINCDFLKKLPENLLPATTLAPSCYSSMFQYCKDLEELPAKLLRATDMVSHCYNSMFFGCSSLNTLPKGFLPAKNLAHACYAWMFSSCAPYPSPGGLTTLPENLLPATTLADSCYTGMFLECHRLTNVPNLPAKTLAKDCYANMFNQCSLLSSVPTDLLPATTLAEGCYESMFRSCLNIRNAPLLPAPKLVKNCYKEMFYSCSNLYNIEVKFTSWGSAGDKCTEDWLHATQIGGYFKCPCALNIDTLRNTTTLGTFTAMTDCHLDGLKFIAHEAGTQVSLRRNGSPVSVSLVYSLNNSEWKDYTINDNIIIPKAGDSLLFRAKTTNGAFYSGSAGSHHFSSSGQVKLAGNIMYLLSKDGKVSAMPDNAFAHLFSYCDAIKSLADTLLPAKQLSQYCYYYMFYHCTGLTSLPNNLLPADDLVDFCYYCMFTGCTGLTTLPDNLLPAKNLAYYCYYMMFEDCTGLKKIPSNLLPAEKLATQCYMSMFKGCSGLGTIPDNLLKATELKQCCYYSMFENCTGLTEIPANLLQSDKLEMWCYKQMFSGCTSLTTVPENLLPATTLKSSCYTGMFSGCTALTQAPLLPATKLEPQCYSNMFSGCTNLKHVEVKFTDWGNPSDNCTQDWLKDVNTVVGTGDFICPCELIVDIPSASTVPPTLKADRSTCPTAGLKFIATKANTTLSLTHTGSPDSIELQYCKNTDYWSDYSIGTTITLDNINDSVKFRSKNEADHFSKSGNNYYNFVLSTGKVTLGGNVMYLLSPDGDGETVPDYAFNQLFTNCLIESVETTLLPAKNIGKESYSGMFMHDSILTNAPNLPATTIATGCYEAMFRSCKKLKSAPNLPATTLADSCYASMFHSCFELTEPPELRATTLANYCYYEMFLGCHSLNKAPALPINELKEGCYESMFTLCLALETPPALKAMTLAPRCYLNMFASCSALKTVPALPATSLTEYCYTQMFFGCTSIKTTPELPALTLTPNCYQYMFQGCTALETASEIKATSLADQCCANMFTGCRALQKSPVLLAPTLARACYNEMFSGCSNLKDVTVAFTDWNSGPNATLDWLTGVAEEGNFCGPCELNTKDRSVTTVPTKWRADRHTCKHEGLTFIATQNGTEVSLTKQGGTGSLIENFEYLIATPSTWDTANYYDYTLNNKITLNIGDTLYFRAKDARDKFSDGSTYFQFIIDKGMVKLDGNVMYLLSPDGQGKTIYNKETFRRLFDNCNIEAIVGDLLPATKLTNYCYYRMFYECKYLESIPENLLPAKKLANSCYEYMFAECSSLNSLPSNLLPADTLAQSCYRLMFWNCDAIESIPDGFLPVDSLATKCYCSMFSGCDKLSSIPDNLLQATQLADGCYQSMFSKCAFTALPTNLLNEMNLKPSCYESMFDGCAQLTSAPNLPATSLAKSCYASMFKMCTNLETAPELNATNLAVSCYEGMFNNCTKLVEAPILPAPTLVKNCYADMFANCSNLNRVEVNFTDWNESSGFSCTENWLNNVSPEGCFLCPTTLNTSTRDGSHVPPTPWLVNDCNPKDGLKFYATVDNTTIQLVKEGTPTDVTLEYSLNNADWIEYQFETTPDNTPESITIPKAGDSLFFRAVANNGAFARYTISPNDVHYHHFITPSGSVRLAGNIMYLLQNDGATNLPDYAFHSLFKGCSIVSIADTLLPASKVVDHCYAYLFAGCPITKIPETLLPANTLGHNCYAHMFDGCTSLTEIPKNLLQAEHAADACYYGMFQNCTNLTNIPAELLPATELESFCYYSMFAGCTSLTSIPKPLLQKATKMYEWCYASMFSGCTSLTAIPDAFLPSESLAKYCYASMFSGCSQLTAIPTDLLPAKKMENGCYSSMFSNCQNLGTLAADLLPATELADECYTRMFAQCSNLKTIPGGLLRNATTMATQCCESMFTQCSSLEDIPETLLPATILAPRCYYNMFSECTTLTKLDENLLPASDLTKKCYEQMFAGCTELKDVQKNLLIKAMNLSDSCFYAMFEGCVRLDSAPVLPATNLQYACYGSMFKGCSALEYVEVGFNDWGCGVGVEASACASGLNKTTTWLDGVKATGTFLGPCDLNTDYRSESTVPKPWHVDRSACRKEGVQFKATKANTQVWLSQNGSPAGGTVQYSFNEQEWKDYLIGTHIDLPRVNDSVVFRVKDDNTMFSTTLTDYYQFHTNTDGEATLSGNIMYLLSPDGTKKLITGYCFNHLFSQCNITEVADTFLQHVATVSDYGFAYMFEGCKLLTHAPAIPATTLGSHGYESMFEGCEKLTSAPSLASASNLNEYCFSSMFKNCKQLTTPPELPATAMQKGCYARMLEGCDNLTTSPTLSATSLAVDCYHSMFKGCVKLATLPSLSLTEMQPGCYAHMFDSCLAITTPCTLPGTTLADSCYSHMFKNCKQLASTPALSATNMQPYCYAHMFENCTTLTTPPDLGTPILATHCYEAMFAGCSGLSDAPALRSLTLQEACYKSMFAGCSALTKAPDLDATTLANECYDGMFANCTDLKSIKVEFTAWSPTDATTGWMTDLTASGTFYAPCELRTPVRNENTVLKSWKLNRSKCEREGLTFIPTGSFAEVSFTRTSTSLTGDFVYLISSASTWDTANWYDYTYGSNIQLHAGDTLYFRTKTTRSNFSTSSDYFQFVADAGSVKLERSVMYLLDPKGSGTTVSAYAFRNLFANCSIQSVVSNFLPATTIAESCYESMFIGCQTLITAPKLPASIMQKSCYQSMFENCTSLTAPPDFSAATSLAESCYEAMFKGSGLTATASSSLSLSVPTLQKSCYKSMFENCTSLTAPPDFSAATSLAESCYEAMFKGSGLTTAPPLYILNLTESCYKSMFENCTALTTPPDLDATTLAKSCYEAMFKGCSSLTRAPFLPATELKTRCYTEMFSNCAALERVEVQFIDWFSTIEATKDWFAGSTRTTGDFFAPCALNTRTYRDGSHVLPGWTADRSTCHKNGLKFIANQAVTTIQLDHIGGTTHAINLQYSINEEGWQPYTIGTPFTLRNVQDSIVFRAAETPNTTFSTNLSDYYQFKVTGQATLAGNIMYLLSQEVASASLPEYAFVNLFKECAVSSIADTLLPAKTLSTACYLGMFNNCPLLTAIPPSLLPATTLTESCYQNMFAICTGLENLPKNLLPATSLATSCYEGMFSNCSALENVPKTLLSKATSAVAARSYANMFKNCSALRSVPDLPAMTLAESCYESMFYGCEDMPSAPSLPATEMQTACYKSMFAHCDALTNAPTLSATTLAPYCFHSMFYHCSNLTKAPDLPMETLQKNCYDSMFVQCVRLETAPILPAPTLTDSCYYRMFYGCESLNRVEVAFTDWHRTIDATTDWFGGSPMTGNGTFLCPCELDVRTRDEHHLLTGWTVSRECPKDGLKFIAMQPNLSVELTHPDHTTYAVQLEVSRNGGEWEDYDIATTVTVPKMGDSIVFRTRTTYFSNFSTASNNNYQFTVSGQVSLAGNIMYLLSQDASKTDVPEYAFYKLFSGCNILSVADTLLPAITVGKYGYAYMFENCASLITAPNISATTVNDHACQSMFSGCSSLQTPPTINVTTLNGNFCMASMFKGCTSLKTVPELKASTLQFACYMSMFEGCTNLKNAPALSATTIADNCYNMMFKGCTALETAPALPATELKLNCYAWMFEDCSNLTAAPVLNATTLATSCYNSMFKGCSQLKNAPELKATTLAEWCYISMFENCIALETAPELQAGTLTARCYEAMFRGCSSLITAPVLPATTLQTECYKAMFKGCRSLVTPSTMSATTLAESCCDSMFANCVLLKQSPHLLAPSLVNHCYECMFSGCTSLNRVDVEFTSWNPSPYATLGWMSNVASTGTFYGPCELKTTTRNISSIPPSWRNDRSACERCGVTFIATTGTARVALSTTVSSPGSFEYLVTTSTTWDTAEWHDYPLDRDIVLTWSDTLYIRAKGTNTTFSNAAENYKFAVTEGQVALAGKVMYLLSRDGVGDEVPAYAFRGLFESCGIQSVADTFLSATTVGAYGYARMFAGCNSLQTAPNLPATTIGTYSYASMFEGCTSLETTPTFNAAAMASNGYNGMFKGCTKLNVAPELPASILADSCYLGMFEGCKALTAMPTISATSLARSCYESMFAGCESLKDMQPLSITTLATSCYKAMFRGCTALTTPPNMLATTLTESCCDSMFFNCSSLKQSPHLLAQPLVNKCYRYMFAGCVSLDTVRVEFTQWGATEDHCTENWFKDIPEPSTETRTFIGPCELKTPIRNNSTIPPSWRNDRRQCERCGVIFIAEEDNAQVSFTREDGSLTGNFEYIVTTTTTWDTANWYDYSFDNVITLNKGDTLYFRTKETRTDFSTSSFSLRYRFKIYQGKVALAGGVMYLLSPKGDGDRVPKYAFRGLFENCNIVTIADTLLSATTLSPNCYNSMFSGCANLTSLPENLLPATTLSEKCYYSMFSGCTSLTSLPEKLLPATKLSVGCYEYMFSGCTSLTSLPEKLLPATKLSQSCYLNMFSGCTGLTSLSEKLLPATKLSQFCYYSMFSGCTGLTSLPEKLLPATTLSNHCYFDMFSDCSSLTEIPIDFLPAHELSESCYNHMFAGCSSLTKLPNNLLPSTTMQYACYMSMFSKCVSLKTIPNDFLPADELSGFCYDLMFSFCSSLISVPANLLPATESRLYCYSGMFKGCSNLEVAPIINLTENEYCLDSMFAHCSNLKYVEVKFNSWSTPLSTFGWLTNVSPVGCFICPDDLDTETRSESRVPVNWYVNDCRDLYGPKDGLKFIAKEDNTEVSLQKYNSPNDISIEYSLNNAFWETYTIGDTIVLPNHGDTLCFRAKKTNNTFSTDFTNYYQFAISNGKADIAGNVMFLLSKNADMETVPSFAFHRLFAQCPITSIADTLLPATILNDRCYASMFEDCFTLSSIPQPLLPALTLASDCYGGMFRGCTSLQTIPDSLLPATEIAEDCYSGMFYSCTSLQSIPQHLLPATKLKTACYSYMFTNCTSLISAPDSLLPATTLADRCYAQMFTGCSNLTSAPFLLAPTLKELSYASMFSDCPNLSYLKVGFAHWHESATTNWVSNVAPTGFFDAPCELPEIRGENNIPDNWKLKEKWMILPDTADPKPIMAKQIEYCTNDIQILRTFIRNKNFSTISLPFTIDMTTVSDPSHPFYNANVYELTDIVMKEEQIDVIVKQVTILHAGYPYFIKWKTTDVPLIDPIFPNVTISIDTNLLYKNQTESGMLAMYGTLAPINNPKCISDHILFPSDSNSTCIWACATLNPYLQGFRAYFILDKSIDQHDKSINIFDVADYTYPVPPPIIPIDTSTNLITTDNENSNKVIKFLENGHVYIIKSGTKYNILGFKLSNPPSKHDNHE